MTQLKDRLFSQIKKHPAITTLITFYLIYLLSAGLILPYVLKQKLPEWLAPYPELQASVEDVRFNPFLLRLTIDDLHVDELKDADTSKLVGLKQITANLQLSSIFHQALVLSELTIDAPYARVTKAQDEGFIWDAWLPAKPTTEQQTDVEPAEASQPFPVMIDAFNFNKATVDFEDFSRKTPFKKHIGPMDLALTNLSTLPNDEGNYQLTIVLPQTDLPQGDQTAEFHWQGNIGIHPFFSEGRLELNQLAVRTLWDYIQDEVYYEPLNGALAVSFDYQLLTKDTLELVLNNGRIKLSNLVLAGKGETEAVVELTSQEINGLFFDLQSKQVSIDQTKTSGLSVAAERLSDGSIKLAKLFAERPVQEKVKKQVKQETQQEKDWQVTVSEILLEDSDLALQDSTTTPPVQLNLDQMTAKIEDLTLTDTPANFSVSFVSHRPSQPEQQSHLKLEGDFVIPSKEVNLQLDLKDFPVAMIQPYLTPLTELSIDNILFDLNGQARLKNEHVSFDGSTQLREIKLTNQAHSQAILAGEGLYFEGIHLNQAQKSLKIDEILLDRLLLPVTIMSRDESGALTNFSDLVKSNASDTAEKHQDSETGATSAPESTSTSESTAEEEWLVEIGKVSIRDNQLQFSDRGIKEPVYFNIEKLNGVIDQLSSKQLSKADIRLAGEVNGYAPFRVTGKINPLSEQAYTNVEVSMSDIALSTFSPYSSHFMNYPLTQGKLSTDLVYKLNQSELVADNKLFIDQLELGNYVESDAGLGLPLPLAISLLQTNSGEIDINLPIKGNLKDPDFKYGQVVINALLNIITKAITSPFQLIANLAGSDADLSNLEFLAGTSELAPDSQNKITELVTALKKRESLKLSVMGQTDGADNTTFKALAWRRFVDQQGITVDYQNPRYQALLAKHSGQALPQDPIKTQALEQSVIEQQALATNQLAALAQERAVKARRLLVDAGLSEKRIFIKASALEQTTQSSSNAVGIKLEVK